MPHEHACAPREEFAAFVERALKSKDATLRAMAVEMLPHVWWTQIECGGGPFEDDWRTRQYRGVGVRVERVDGQACVRARSPAYKRGEHVHRFGPARDPRAWRRAFAQVEPILERLKREAYAEEPTA